jgi:hypothetical protein
MAMYVLNRCEYFINAVLKVVKKFWNLQWKNQIKKPTSKINFNGY